MKNSKEKLKAFFIIILSIAIVFPLFGTVTVRAEGKVTANQEDNLNLMEPTLDDAEQTEDDKVTIEESKQVEEEAQPEKIETIGETEQIAEPSKTMVASIGDRTYEDIIQAVKEVKAGETILLLEDIQIQFADPNNHNAIYVADFADNVTLDLNGHILTNAYMSFILQGNNLTVKNGTIKSVADYALYLGDERTTTGIIVENITTDGGINIYNTSVTLRNVKVTGRGYYAVWADENAQVVMESGTYGKYIENNKVNVLLGLTQVKSDVPASTMTIKGGNFINPYDTLALQSTESTLRYQPVIYGGTFNCNVAQYLAEGVSMEQNANGEYIVGYKIIVDNSKITGGNISVTKTIANAGNKIQVKYQANEGYKLKEIVVVDSHGNSIKVNADNTFIMPESNATITATFEKFSTEIMVPEIDTTKPVEEVEIGVTDTNKVEEILKNALEAIAKNNEEVANKLENADVTIELEINDKPVIEQGTKEKIEVVAKKIAKDIKIADYFDILIEIKANNVKVGEITELASPITLVVALPENLQTIEEGYIRTYYIVREHNNEAEVLNATLHKDGKYITFTSDKFSSFALAYIDRKIEEPKEPVNVDTGTTITGDFIILVISIVGIGVLLATRKYIVSKH